MEPLSIKLAGQAYTLRVSATILGDPIWLKKANAVGGFVTVGARLHNEAKKPVEMDYGRAHLSADVHPGEMQSVDVDLVAHMEKGAYHVGLDMVCKVICWFAQRGSHAL